MRSEQSVQGKNSRISELESHIIVMENEFKSTREEMYRLKDQIEYSEQLLFPQPNASVDHSACERRIENLLQELTSTQSEVESLYVENSELLDQLKHQQQIVHNLHIEINKDKEEEKTELLTNSSPFSSSSSPLPISKSAEQVRGEKKRKKCNKGRSKNEKRST